MDQGYWTVDEVAEYLGFSTGTIYNKVNAGEFPHHKISAKCIRFKKSEVDQWLHEQENKMPGKQDPEKSPSHDIPSDILQIFQKHPVAAPAFLRRKFSK